jgi:hypothetical protein
MSKERCHENAFCEVCRFGDFSGKCFAVESQREIVAHYGGYEQFELMSFCLDKDQRIVELEEQLKGCIRPKFKVGQTVYTFNKNTECVYELCIKIIRIEINEIAKFNSLVYLAERLEDGNFFGYFEVELFATKEEAQAKLKELQGES